MKKTPRLEIDLVKIEHNTRVLNSLLKAKGVSLMGITKAVLGEPRVAEAMVRAGIKLIGDSRIENIKRIRRAGIKAELVMIRTPLLSEVNQVVKHADISLNSELIVLRALSKAALKVNKQHKVIIMIELGDLREGLLYSELDAIMGSLQRQKGIEVIGVGTNLGCLGGVVPADDKMTKLSDIADRIEKRYGCDLSLISGGNSATFTWLEQTNNSQRINNLRIGEMIYLGWETLNYQPVSGLYGDAITLVSEVIEFKHKASIPDGVINHDAFGQTPIFKDRGTTGRAILGLGQQDVDTSGLRPVNSAFNIIGSSSDHLVFDPGDTHIQVGDEIRFQVNYSAFLKAMTSPYVRKVFSSQKSLISKH